MSHIKSVILFSILLLSQIGFSQVSDNLMLYRKDFKNISGDNTVSIISYEKNGSHYVYAGGDGNVDVFSLDIEGILN